MCSHYTYKQAVSRLKSTETKTIMLSSNLSPNNHVFTMYLNYNLLKILKILLHGMGWDNELSVWSFGY